MSEEILFTFDKINKIFNLNVTKNTFYSAAERNEIPAPLITKRGKTNVRQWPLSSIPQIGSKYSFLRNNKGRRVLDNLPCAVILSYARKGGVLKTTCAFNLARIAALNGIKTCIIGLDNQCDISRILGHYSDTEEIERLDEYESILESKQGLYEVFNKDVELKDVILQSSLPTLYFLPETDKIEFLSEALEGANRREYWLEENVISKLRRDFDLIVLDCSPTSGRLLQNAIFSSDMIMAPIECAINNFRNFKSLEAYLKRTIASLKKDYLTLRFIPTKLKNTSLSKDIFSWYITNIPDCTKKGIKMASVMEDSIFQGQSILEHSPVSSVAEDVKEIMTDILFELDLTVSDKIYSQNLSLEKQLVQNRQYAEQI